LDKKISTNHLLAISSLIFGLGILVFLSVILFTQIIIFIIGLKISRISLVIGIFSTLIFFIFTYKKYRVSKKNTLFFFIMFSFLVIIVISISSLFYDSSWDGRDYHYRAITQLYNGWNPVYDLIEPSEIYFNVWLNHYPKGTWILSSVIYLLTGNIESGKSINLLLLLSVFFLSFSTCYYLKIGINKSFLYSFLIAFNPVSVTQLFTNYVDGIIASIFSLFLLLSILTWLGRIPFFLQFIGFFSLIILGFNIKFTGTSYLGLLIVGQMAFFFFTKRQYFYRLTLLNLSFSFIALFIVGYNPYVTNFLNNGNPLFPTFGSSQFNLQYVMSGQSPSNFEKMSGIEKTSLSIFARSQNTYGSETGPVKFPLSISKSEILAFGGPDTRIGGWGPFFGASLIFTFMGAFFMIINKAKFRYFWVFIVCLITITIIINPESWWARYTPQFWLIPVITLVFIWELPNSIKIRKILSFSLATILLINIFFVAGPNFYNNIKTSHHLNQEIIKIKKSNRLIYISYGPLVSIESTLNHEEIEFQVIHSHDKHISPRMLLPGVEYSYSIIE